MRRTELIPIPATLLALGCLGLGGGPLRADDRLVGAQVALDMPQSDMNGGKWYHGQTGLGLGVHWVFWHHDNHAFRLRGDGIFYPRGPINVFTSDGATQLWTLSAKTRIVETAVEYNFYFNSTDQEGLYLIMGLGYSWATFYGGQLVPGGGSAPSNIPWPNSTRGNSNLYSLGMGSRVTRNLGWEFRFTQAYYMNLGPGGTGVKDPTLSLAMTFDL
ncbi:MAG: hypothetical protein ABSH53_08890 [Holophaga sp.]|jgi:hypothetical protein